MACDLNTQGMYAIEEIRGDSDHDTDLLRQMAKTAASFLQEHSWCERILKQLLAFGIGGVIGIFLCEILPNSEKIDRCLWVITGDLPPAYLITNENPTPLEALDAYVEEMSTWVEAARSGRTVEDLIPVNAMPTLENADLLASRLECLKTTIRPMILSPKT